MKRLLSALIAVMLLTGVFAGCYMTRPGKLKDVLGTYKLESYSRSGDGLIDYIERDEIVCYLVIRDANNGYYIYKDKYTTLSVREIKISLTPDTEEPDKYSFVNYTIDDTVEAVKLGFSRGSLNATTYDSSGNIFEGNYDAFAYQNYTNFKRLDKAKDLSYVKKEIGELPQTVPYNYGAYDGVYVYSGFDCDLDTQYEAVYNYYDEPFVYAYIDFDPFKGEAIAYYMLKSDEIQREDKLPASVVVGQTAMLNIGNKVFSTKVTEFHPKNIYMYIPETLTYGEGEGESFNFRLTFDHCNRRSGAIEERIQYAIEQYQNSKEQVTE